MEIELEKYRILETGADGGHKYISSSLKYNGSQREITVIFKNKKEEQKLTEGIKLRIKGILQDARSTFFFNPFGIKNYRKCVRIASIKKLILFQLKKVG